jgi:hypothetical protein
MDYGELTDEIYEHFWYRLLVCKIHIRCMQLFWALIFFLIDLIFVYLKFLANNNRKYN